jgi:hypothetical protein
VHESQKQLLVKKQALCLSISKKVKEIEEVSKYQTQVLRNVGASKEDQTKLLEKHQEDVSMKTLKQKIGALKQTIKQKE